MIFVITTLKSAFKK